MAWSSTFLAKELWILIISSISFAVASERLRERVDGDRMLVVRWVERRLVNQRRRVRRE